MLHALQKLVEEAGYETFEASTHHGDQKCLGVFVSDGNSIGSLGIFISDILHASRDYLAASEDTTEQEIRDSNIVWRTIEEAFRTMEIENNGSSTILGFPGIPYEAE